MAQKQIVFCICLYCLHRPLESLELYKFCINQRYLGAVYEQCECFLMKVKRVFKYTI